MVSPKATKMMKPIVAHMTPQMWATRERLNLKRMHDLAGGE
jgi:hypothetical protein